MDFTRKWTKSSLEAETNHYGLGRVVQAHNDIVRDLKEEINSLREQLARETTFEPKQPLTKINFDLLNEKEKDASEAIAQDSVSSSCLSTTCRSFTKQVNHDFCAACKKLIQEREAKAVNREFVKRIQADMDALPPEEQDAFKAVGGAIAEGLIASLGYVSAYLLDDEQLKVTLATQQLVEATRQLYLNGFVCKPYENKQRIHDIVGNEMFEVKGVTDYRGHAQYISWFEPSDERVQEVAERFFQQGRYHIALFKGNQLQQVVKNVCTFDDALASDETIKDFHVLTLIRPRFIAGGIWEPTDKVSIDVEAGK